MSRIEEALAKAEQSHGRRGSRSTAGSVTPPKMAMPATVLTEDVKTRISGQPFLVAANDPLSPVAEEYRKLKENLVKMTKEKGFQNMIMVTSSVAGEGKSLTSVNLAITLAQEFDHTVLLVDADLRRPTCHSLLGIEPEFGLSECLLEGRDVGDAFVKTGIGKLVFLPAGKAMQNPGELFSSSVMKELLEELKHRYPDRYVIIDTPPVLPFTDSRSLSRLVDGAIMVVKEGQVSPKELLEAVDEIKATNLLGVVYNQSTQTIGSSGYYGYYHYNRES